VSGALQTEVGAGRELLQALHAPFADT